MTCRGDDPALRRKREGYYRNQEATRSRFRDGCYWSGDLAYRDAGGWLYFAGRLG